VTEQVARASLKAQRVRICVCDYAGHPFQVQLSRALANRGHDVLHLYFAEFQTPRGRLSLAANDPATLSIEGVSLGTAFAKYSFVKRWFQERAIGRRIAQRIEIFAPQVVLASNLPIDTLTLVLRACRNARRRFVFWQQDIYSGAILTILQRKLGWIGYLVGKHYERLERRAAAGSSAIVVIAERFKKVLEARFGIAPHKVSVIENWAPLDEITTKPKANPWSLRYGLAQYQVILYTGTLGLKHNPSLILSLARALQSRPNARVVVVSEGPFAEWLSAQAKQQGLDNILILPFQPYEAYPDVLASADVLISMIDNDAGEYSVPSKVLSYLCAGRATVLSAPKENLAVEIIERAGAGTVCPVNDANAFIGAIERLLQDAAMRETFGQQARHYAETMFDIGKIADRFETIMRSSPQCCGAAVAGPS
jgi:colanic acid biosynthesis glycosyl transferase WcaI